MFLRGRLGYLEMASLVEQVLGEFDSPSVITLDEVAAAEDWARARAREIAA